MTFKIPPTAKPGDILTPDGQILCRDGELHEFGDFTVSYEHAQIARAHGWGCRAGVFLEAEHIIRAPATPLPASPRLQLSSSQSWMRPSSWSESHHSQIAPISSPQRLSRIGFLEPNFLKPWFRLHWRRCPT